MRVYEPQSAGVDTGKVFEALEGEVLRLQVGIDRMQNVVKQRKDLAVYRGRLASKRNLHPISRLLSSLSGETSPNLPQMRSFCLSESLAPLISTTLSPQYTKSSLESLLRLAILKAQLLELVLKKAGELALLYLWMRWDEEAIGRLSGSVEIWVKCLEVLGAEEGTGQIALETANEKDLLLSRAEEQVRSQAKVMEGLRKEVESAQKDSKQQQIAYESRLKALKEALSRAEEAVLKAKAETKQEPIRRSQSIQTENDPATETKRLKETILALQQEKDAILRKSMEWEQSAKQAEAEIAALQQGSRTESQETLQKLKSAQNEVLEKTGEVDRLREERLNSELAAANQAAQYQRLLRECEEAGKQAEAWRSRLDQQSTSAKQAEACLALQLAQEVQQSAQFRALLDSKDLEIAVLIETKVQLKAEIEENKGTIDRLQRSLSQLINMDEDTFEAVMKNEMDMMRNAYEQRLKDLRCSYDSLKREKTTETRALKEALAEKERVLELISSKLV